MFNPNSDRRAFLSLLFFVGTLFYMLAVWAAPSFEVDEAPWLYILGVTQDGGYPQAGCYAPHCLPAWEDASLQRGPVALGLIDPGAGKKYLFEATPDLPRQLYELDREAPGERYTLDGIFLTHGHIGHYTGLMFLGHEAMGASKIPVYAMPRLSEFLQTNGPWSQLVNYGNISLNPLRDGGPVALGRIKVTPFLVPHREEYSEVVGYRIEGPNKSAVFIPDIDKWSKWDRDISEVVKGVDYALLDATFYGEGELPGRDMSKIPHPFVTESMKALQELTSEERGRVWFIHMNHTNPLLNPESGEVREVRSRGFNVGQEGMRLPL